MGSEGATKRGRGWERDVKERENRIGESSACVLWLGFPVPIQATMGMMGGVGSSMCQGPRVLGLHGRGERHGRESGRATRVNNRSRGG